MLDIQVSEDLNCAATSAGYPEHPDIFYNGTACATFLFVDGEVYGPSRIPAGPQTAVAWTPLEQERSGDGTALSPTTIVTRVAAGTTGVELVETDTHIRGTSYWDTTARISNPNGNSVSRVTRAQDCYVAASDVGVGQIDHQDLTTYCEGRTAAIALTPLSPDASVYEDGYRSVWNAAVSGQTLPGTANRSLVDNGQAVSWSLDTGTAPAVRKWRTTLVTGPSAAEQGRSPNGSQLSTTCSTPMPVNCATGDFWHTFTDLTIDGRLPITFTRTYDAALSDQDNGYGHGWSSSYGMHLDVDRDSALVRQENGSVVVFSRSERGTWTAPLRVLATLTETAGGGFVFMRYADHVQYSFDSNGSLISITDRTGSEKIDLGYRSGQLTTVRNSAGQGIDLTWSGAKVVGVSATTGRSIELSYDGAGNLVRSQDGEAYWTFGYDSAHHLTTMTNPLTDTLTNVYDSQFRVVEQTSFDGAVTRWDYDGDPASTVGSTTTIIDRHGNTRVETYSNMLLLTSAEAVGTEVESTTQYGYDLVTLGLVETMTADGQVARAAYDSHGNMITTVDQAGGVTNTEFDQDLDVPVRITDPQQNTRTFAHSVSGVLESTTDERGVTTTFEHRDPAHPADVTARVTGSVHRSFEYDSAGHVVAERAGVDGRLLVDSAVYDARGNLVCTSTASGSPLTGCPTRTADHPDVTVYEYDADGNNTSVTDGAGRSTEYTHDILGRRTASSAGSGVEKVVTTVRYDSIGRAVETVTAPGTARSATERSEFDLGPGTGGCPTTAGVAFCSAEIDAAGRRTVTAFDAAASAVIVNSPTGSTRFRHDGVGRPVEKVGPDGHTTRFDYDAVGRLISVFYEDPDTADVGFDYDLLGRRVRMQDGTGVTTYEYDAVGDLLAVSTSAGTMRAERDSAGALTTLTYPDGSTVRRTYDDTGRLVRITDPNGRPTAYTYDRTGLVSATSLGNGAVLTNTFDGAGVLRSVTATASGATVASLAYQRDSVGRVRAESGDATGTFSYDERNLLTGSDRPTGSTAYSYDPTGLPTSLGNTALRYRQNQTLLSSGSGSSLTNFSYNAAGQRISSLEADGDRTFYQWDRAGRMLAAASIEAPTVLGGVPASGGGAGGTAVTISGRGFVKGMTTVRFGTQPAARVTVNSSTSLVAVSPPGTGSVDIAVSTPVGPSDRALPFRFVGPSISGLSSVSGLGRGGQSVRITGHNLVGVKSVRFGTVSARHSVTSPTSITAVVPAGSGSVAVSVTTQEGTSVAAQRYSYVLVPVLTRLSRTVGPVAGAYRITITGANLAGVKSVRFGSRAATGLQRISDSALSVVVPPGTGSVDVVVTGPRGVNAKSAAARFTFSAGPAITGVSPSAGAAVGGNRITVSGYGFTKSSQIKVGGRAATAPKFLNSRTIQVTAPAGAGNATVVAATGKVIGPAWAGRYTYRRPVASSMTPSTGSISGGDEVVIRGTRFTGTTSVKFGTRSASFTVRDDTTLIARSPAGPAGAVDVLVTTREGTSVASAQTRFRWSAVPIVGRSTPTVVPSTGTTTIEITGRNLRSATSVHFGSVAAESFTILSDASIRATVPAGVGVAEVTVRSVAGTSLITPAAAIVRTTRNESYQYNGDGLRVSTTTDGRTTATVWNPFTEVPVPAMSGTTLLITGVDDRPLEQFHPDGAAEFLLLDQIGSVRALLGTSGAVIATRTWSDLGRLTSSTGSVASIAGFAGGYQGGVGNLVYLLNRWYDADTGQFLSVDPAVSATGAPYSYAAGDPINGADRTGLWPGLVIGAIVGAIVGGAVGAVKYATSSPDARKNSSLFASVAGGVVGGAASGACMGATAFVGAALCSGAASALGTAVEQGINGKFDVAELGISAASGVALGALGSFSAASKLRAGWWKQNYSLNPAKFINPSSTRQIIMRDSVYGSTLGAAVDVARSWTGWALKAGHC